MKDAFKKVMESELDNLIYLAVGICLVGMLSFFPEMAAPAKAACGTLLGIVCVKVKGA
jgi:hypothetical protein